MGNLWLFGGERYAASGSGRLSMLNDLWKYNPTTNEWTWVKGDNTYDRVGVYGTQGSAAAGNKPGARDGSISWSDASGNLWLFGGYGYAASGISYYLNDFWKYNPFTNEWTWVKGDNTVNQLGVYGTQGTAAAGNKPGSRSGSVSWTDASGNLWLFGGFGNAASGYNFLNDLWKYNPATNEWTWVKGDNTNEQVGVYGTQGTAAAGNNPGSRYGSVSWKEASGNLWLFGGYGYAAIGYGNLNDLWKYVPAPNLTITCPKDTNSNIISACSRYIKTAEPLFRHNSNIGSLAWTATGATVKNSGNTGDPIKLVGGESFNKGMTVITYSLTDSFGTTVTCSYKVTINDLIKPIFIDTNSNITKAVITGCNALVNIANISGSDNCGIPAISWVKTGATTGSGFGQLGSSPFNVGTTQVKYTLTDSSGNTRTNSFEVVVKDRILPTMVCLADTTRQALGSDCFRYITIGLPGYSDNCSVKSISWTLSGATAGNSTSTGIIAVGYKKFNVGKTVITYTAKDASNNIAKCTTNVTVTSNVCRSSMPASREGNIETKGKTWNVSISPNPAKESFILTISSEEKQQVNVVIFSQDGKRIEQLKTMPGQLKFGESYAQGAYLIEVRQGKKRITVKGLKQ